MESAPPGRDVRGSAKGCEPEELRAWKQVQRENDIEPKYRDLPRPERDAMESTLYTEQTGQCVYCGRGVSPGVHGDCHVEHFRPQSKYPELQLDHANLFLSCGPVSVGPEGEHGIRETCGIRKEDWFEEERHVPPAPESCAERFRFRSSGHIAGRGAPEAEKMIEVLNLNHPALVTERRNLIESLDEDLNEDVPGDDLLRSYRDTDGSGARPSFANVAIGYLGGWQPGPGLPENGLA